MKSKIDIKDRLHNLIMNRETDYAKDIYRNPVKEYIDAKRNLREKTYYLKIILFVLEFLQQFQIKETGLLFSL